MAGGNLSTADTEGVPSSPSPSPSPSPLPVFIDTNLDTHLAMIVSPDDTVADLKSKVRLEHRICFPNIGDITVCSMKVRRKATFYHLSDSMLVRTALDGIKGTWFLHMDVAHVDGNGNVAGGDANKTKWGIMDGPPSVDGLSKADSTQLSGPSAPGVPLILSACGQKQCSRLEVPTNDVLPIIHGQASKGGSAGVIKLSGKSENSAAELGGTSHIVISENHKAFSEANKVLTSHCHLATGVLADHLDKDIGDKDFADLNHEANDDDASIGAAEKEKSRKRSIILEDGHLLKSSSEKKRRKKGQQKGNDVPCNDHDKDLLELIQAVNVVQGNISSDLTVGEPSMFGHECSQQLKDDSVLPQERPPEKKKRNKKRRRESDEHYDEVDGISCLDASTGCKSSVKGVEPSEPTSNENNLALGKEPIEHMVCPISDKNLGSKSDMVLTNEKNVEYSTNGNCGEVDSEVFAKKNKKSAHRRKKTITKDELTTSEFGKAETEPSEPTSNENTLALGKETMEHNQERVYAISDNNLCPNSDVVLLNEKNVEDSTNENHMEVDPEVFVKKNKKSVNQRMVTKGELPTSEFGDAETEPAGPPSNVSCLALGKETIEHNEEKVYPISDNNLGSNSDMVFPNEKNVEDLTNGNHVEVDSEVLAKKNKKSVHRRKKKVTKGELLTSEFGKAENFYPLGKQINGENLEEVPADDPENLDKRPNGEIVSEDACRHVGAVEILPEALPDDGRNSSCSKERSYTAELLEIKSSKDGAFSSAANAEELMATRNFMEADSSIPNADKGSMRSKKKSVKAKKSCVEAPRKADHPISGSTNFPGQTLMDKHAEVGNVRARADAAFLPKAIQQGLVNSEGESITWKSGRRKVHQSGTVNSDLVEPPKDLLMKQTGRLHKLKALKMPHVQNDERWGKPDVSDADMLQASNCSPDQQIPENHDQDIFSVNESRKPKQHAEEKGPVDYLGANSSSGQQKTDSHMDNPMKQMNAYPPASDDSTEDDTAHIKRLYRVAARKKVPKVRSKKDVNKSKQEVVLNTEDNIFGHSLSSSSEDADLGHTGKDASGNVFDTLTSDDSEDLTQTQVAVGPRAQMSTSFQGASLSSTQLSHKKEGSEDDVLLSQTSGAAKKHITLGALLRNSRSYRRAKVTATIPNE